MAKDLNKVIITCRLCADPEVKTFASGGKVANMRLAVNNSKKNQQTGQWEDNPTFVDASAFNRGDFGKTADTVEQYLKKGSRILVEGRLRLEQWEDKNGGGKRSKVSIDVDNIVFIDTKNNSDGNGGAAPATEQRASRTNHFDDNGGGGGNYTEEIPF